LNFQQLRYFCEVCKQGSIANAARELFVSQPAISNSIQSLEKELGIQLFTRYNKRLYLTKAGENVLYQTEGILNAVDSLVSSCHQKSMKSAITLCASPVPNIFYLPKLLEDFSKQNTSISLNVRESGSIRALQLLARDEVDLALMLLSDSISENYNVIPLSKTSVVYTVHSQHPMAKCAYIDLEQLVDTPFIIMQNEFYQTGTMVLKRFHESGIAPTNYLMLNQLQLITKLIIENQIGAFLIENFSRNKPDLIGIPLKPELSVDIGIVWKKNNVLPDGTEALIDFIKDLHF